MTIIAATDFSATAANAARNAVALARKLGDKVLLVTVVEPPLQYHHRKGAGEDAPAYDALLRESAQKLMDEAVAALRGEGITVEGRVLIGAPVPALSALATEEHARVLVMGAHDLGQVARVFFGSVSERTVLDAPCPVLVVPAGTSPFDGQ